MRRRIFNHIFVLVTVLLVSDGSVHGFDYFEHRYLGNKAYREAKARLMVNAPSRFKEDLEEAEKTLGILATRPEGGDNSRDLLDTMPTEFGDLSALAGDHTAEPSKLLDMIKTFDRGGKEEERFIATRRQWVQACRWYKSGLGISSIDNSSMDRCFDQVPRIALDVSAKQYPGTSKGYEPSRLELADFEKLAYYVRLAEDNRKHFPKHSWRAYLDYHTKAVNCAEEYQKRNLDKCGTVAHEKDAIQALVFALIYEGFAQHFLHDSFSSGHIGTKFGTCLSEKIGVKIFPLVCRPNKQIVQHTHDSLNTLGIRVKSRMPRDSWETSEKEMKFSEENGWTAYGDRHLFITEGLFHRRILESVAIRSVVRVLGAAHLYEDNQMLCSKIIGSLPVLAESTEDIMSDCTDITSEQESDLPQWTEGRSPNLIVPDLSAEGWKFLVSWGILYGRFTHLNEDGSTKETRRGVTFGTVEIGYVRSTSPWMPNYLGFGTSIAPGNRFSIYPISVGYWRPHEIGKFFGAFGGIRLNAGVRITEPFSAENPTTHRDDTAELNMPLDLGLEIYSPIALYLRADLLTVNFPVLPSKAIVDSIFVGRGAVTLGLRFDLAGILP